MNIDCHRFRIGSFECTVVSDGTFSYPYPDKMFFVNAEHDDLVPALSVWGIDLATWDTYVSPYPSLLVDTGTDRVLVDAGAGNLGPSTGQLSKNLESLGVDRNAIDVVVLSHAHPDHIGGVLDSRGLPSFPNARHVISKTEWDFWTNQPNLDHLPIPAQFRSALLECPLRNLPPLSKCIELIEPDTEIVPGIRAIDAAGHTPGQLAIEVSSRQEILIASADVVVHPIHLSHPHWYTAVDFDPPAAVESRRRLLRRAVADQVLLFAYHFPTPGLGRVEQNGDTWQWVAAHS